MDTLVNVAHGFGVALLPINLLYCFIGVFIGTLVGVLPGIGPISAMSLLLPITLSGTPESGIIMMAGIYYGSMYGGSTTSILVNIPGEAASVVTCIDGHQMAKQGRAGPALGISAFGSFIAGTFSLVALMLVAPKARQRRDCLWSGRIFQPDGARPRRADLPHPGLDGQGAPDGLHRRRAWPDRARQHHRAAAADLRPDGTDRRHRARAGRDGPVRRRRGLLNTEQVIKRDIINAKITQLLAEQGRLEGERRPNRPRHSSRLLPRHSAGRRRGRGLLCLLRAGEAAVENARALRQWRDRGCRGTGIRQQRGRWRRLHSADDARHPAQCRDGAACSAPSSSTACSRGRC